MGKVSLPQENLNVKIFIVLSLIVLSSSAYSQSAAEEAIILNQELQFLQDSVSTAVAGPASAPSAPEMTGESNVADESLERTYFGSERDSVETKTSAPKRRSF